MPDNLPMRPGGSDRSTLSRNGQNSGDQAHHNDTDSESSTVYGRMTPTERITTIDPRGDLLLHVHGSGPEEDIYRISSACFRLASEAWCNHLDAAPPTDTGEPIQLEFTITVATSRRMLRVLLHIAHSQFARIPPTLDWVELCYLARVCEAHCTVELVRPFLKDWTSPYMAQILHEDRRDWLYVAFAFGYKDHLKSITKHWAIKSTSFPTERPGYALHLILNVKRVREDILTKMVDVCYEFVDLLSDEQGMCRDNQNISKCTSLSLGSFLRGLRSLSLWPRRPDAQEVTLMSVEQFRAQLLRLEILPYHTTCDVTGQFGAKIISADRDIQILTGEMEEHFRTFPSA